MLRAALLSLLVMVFSAPAFAEGQNIIKSDNPHIQKAQDKAVDIAKTFTPAELENLGIIKDGFGIINAVQMTNKSVSTTVKKCGEEHPEMKAEMDAQYNEWKSGVITVLATKEKEMKTAISDGRFSKPKEVTAFLDLLDKAAQYAYDKMDKQPLTTPSACEALRDKMDETASKLEELMAELKFPRAIPKDKPEVTAPKAGANE